MALFTNISGLFLTIVVVYCSVILSPTNAEDQAKLELTQVLYRHGDRSPVIPYPNDNHNLTEWLHEGAQGYGQLTYLGMRQHYELGKWFHYRYVNKTGLMDSNYNRSQLVVRSTDVERTLMSAYCNLAGFFPPDPHHTWWPSGDTINWQPIPVHTVPASLDNLLDMGASCPMADELYNREKETKEFRKKAKDNKNLFAFLSNVTGRQHQDLDILWQTVDTLFCEQSHNMTLPDWAGKSWTQQNQTQTIYQWLLGLQSWEFDLKYGEPDQKARLRGGPLLKEMLHNMKQAIHKNSTIKFYMYSAHDNTVMAFMHALRVSNHLQPPYTATVMVELYSINATYAVKVLYRNDSSAEPYTMTVPHCTTIGDDLCPYDQFVKLTESMIPDNWEKECEIPPPKTVNERYIIGIGVGAGIVFVCIVIVIVFIIKKKKAGRPDGYYGINQDV